MSAASGLAAAKRRRGASGGASGGGISNQNQPTQSIPPPPQKITPMQILTQHHIRLEQIELNQAKDSEAIENIGFFHEKINQLELKINELQSLLSKVQKSSLDTNISFVEFKNEQENKVEPMVSSSSTKQSKTSKKNGMKVKEESSDIEAPSFS